MNQSLKKCRMPARLGREGEEEGEGGEGKKEGGRGEGKGEEEERIAS